MICWMDSERRIKDKLSHLINRWLFFKNQGTDDYLLTKDPESGSIPLENLDEGASAVAECKHAARVWVELEFEFDDGRQTIVAFSEICCPAGKIYRCTACQVKHSLLTSLSAPGIILEDRTAPPRSGCIPK